MNINLYNPVLFLMLYLVVLNLYGLAIMGIDKRKAEKSRYRIPEKIFFIIALLGGGAGIYAGMKLFHHKTLHNKFRYGIPTILLANIICIVYLLMHIQ